MRQDLYGRLDRVVFFQDGEGSWRWNYRAAGNGKVLAASDQGYSDLDDARLTAERVLARRIVFGATVDQAAAFPQDEIPGVMGWSGAR